MKRKRKKKMMKKRRMNADAGWVVWLETLSEAESQSQNYYNIHKDQHGVAASAVSVVYLHL